MQKENKNLKMLKIIIGIIYLAVFTMSINTYAQKTTNNVTTENNTEYSIANTDTITDNSVAKDKNDALINGFLIFLAVLLIAYIVAIVRTRTGKMYTFANWWDFMLLIIAGIGLSLGLMGVLNGEPTLTVWIILSVGILAFLGTLFLSIKINKGSGLNIALSISAKLFVFVIIALIIVVWLIGDFLKSMGKNNLANNSSTSVSGDLKDIERGEKMQKFSKGMAGFLLVSLIALKWKMPQPIEK